MKKRLVQLQKDVTECSRESGKDLLKLRRLYKILSSNKNNPKQFPLIGKRIDELLSRIDKSVQKKKDLMDEFICVVGNE